MVFPYKPALSFNIGWDIDKYGNYKVYKKKRMRTNKHTKKNKEPFKDKFGVKIDIGCYVVSHKGGTHAPLTISVVEDWTGKQIKLCNPISRADMILKIAKWRADYPAGSGRYWCDYTDEQIEQFYKNQGTYFRRPECVLVIPHEFVPDEFKVDS